MIVSYDETGVVISVSGYRGGDITKEMIDSLHPNSNDQQEFTRIYDIDLMNEIWEAHDTGGEINIILSATGDVMEINTVIGPNIPEPAPTDIELLQQENTLIKAQNNAISERADFMEDLIAEMAMMIYP